MAAYQAGIQVGRSFCEIGLWQNGKLHASDRFYLPSEALSVGLGRFFKNHPEITLEKITVSTRYLEKILDTKLGGTVAQVVTRGFETWPILRQPVLPKTFDLNPFRQEPLASQDLIFGVSARMDALGKETSPLVQEELDALLAKFQKSGVKRVCINLLHAHRNSTHQNQITEFFEKHGFDVFTSHRHEDSLDEMPAWRKTILNACLYGSFVDHSDELEAFFGKMGVTPEQIYFLNGNAKPFQKNKEQIASSLFAWTQQITQIPEWKNQIILHLGLESWSLLKDEPQYSWESPWGSIEAIIPWNRKLSLQPTSEVGAAFFGGTGFTNEELGFEPGPVSFGRGQKPMLFDVLELQQSSKFSQISANGSKRLKDQWTAVAKNSPELGGWTFDDMTKNLFESLLQQLTSEIIMTSPTRNLVVTGFFAPILFPELKKRLPKYTLRYDEQAKDRLLLMMEGT